MRPYGHKSLTSKRLSLFHILQSCENLYLDLALRRELVVLQNIPLKFSKFGVLGGFNKEHWFHIGSLKVTLILACQEVLKNDFGPQ